MTGVWQALNSAAHDIQDHTGQLGVPAGQGVVEGNEIPYLPWAAERQQKNYENRRTENPETRCYLPGVPRATYMPYPFQIVQGPTYIMIGYEYAHTSRRIAMDGSPHPEVVDSWMGDSRGHWEGDTLVVDVRSFNGRTWFDRAGNFHSDALRVVERFTPITPYHLRLAGTASEARAGAPPACRRLESERLWRARRLALCAPPNSRLKSRATIDESSDRRHDRGCHRSAQAHGPAPGIQPPARGTNRGGFKGGSNCGLCLVGHRQVIVRLSLWRCRGRSAAAGGVRRA